MRVRVPVERAGAVQRGGRRLRRDDRRGHRRHPDADLWRRPPMTARPRPASPTAPPAAPSTAPSTALPAAPPNTLVNDPTADATTQDTQSETTLAADFIALSEKLGLVRLLDYRALELAVEMLGEVPDASLAVNVSANTLGEEDWIAFLAAAAARNATMAPRLIVEITESAIVGSLDEAAHFVATIHALGGRVAIDDFGAGHTSFRNLRALGVDIVKIDGIFIEHLKHAEDDRAFVRALVDLSRSLGIDCNSLILFVFLNSFQQKKRPTFLPAFLRAW